MLSRGQGGDGLELLGIAYITDGHEVANFGIAFGFFVAAWAVGMPSLLTRMDHPTGSSRRLAHLGLFVSGVLGLCAFAMAGVWATRSDLIFRGDQPAPAAASGGGSSSGGGFSSGGGSSSGAGSSGGSTSPNSGSSDFCSTHTCIGNFDNEAGYIVKCADETYSHAGGLSGACSHHGGEASGPIAAGSTDSSPPSTPASETTTSVVPATPTVPTDQHPAGAPASEPHLTGLTSASSGGFNFTVKGLVAQKDLDQAGSPPSFGVGVIASCSEPDASITTWNLSSGGPSYSSGIASCLQGSINPNGMAVTMTVTGCGDHVLTVTPMGYGPKVDGVLRPQARPMHFPFQVCR